MTRKKSLDREAAKREPERAFHRPLEILDEKLLTRGEKLATLERWRQSLLEELRATDEGMPAQGHSAEQASLLNEIEEATRRLSPPESKGQ